MSADAKLNRLDRIVAWISPEAGARRAAHRINMNAMAARDEWDWGSQRKRGRRAKRRRQNIDGYGAPTPQERLALVEQSLEQVACNPLASGIVGIKVAHVVGNGFRMQPRADGKALGWDRQQTDEFNDQVGKQWAAFANSTDCDDEGLCQFADLTELAYRSMLETGDAFCLLQREGANGAGPLRLQIMGGQRVASPRPFPGGGRTIEGQREHDGAALDARGRVQGYWVNLNPPWKQGGGAPAQFAQVDLRDAATGRRNIVHLFRKIKTGQKRGLPDLAPALAALTDIGKYSAAELRAAQVSSLFTAFIKSDAPLGGSPIAGALDGDGLPLGDPSAPKLTHGAIMDLGPGVDLTFAHPTRPQSNFSQFIECQLRLIGMALNIPFEVLIQHFTASYSASKAALVLAQRYFMAQRRLLAARFCQPIYEEWFDDAVMGGRIVAPGFADGGAVTRQAFLRADWIGAGRPQLDEEKEAKARATRLSLGLTTLAEEIQEHSGRDYIEVLDQREREKEEAEARGLAPPGLVLPVPGAAGRDGAAGAVDEEKAAQV